MDTIKTKQELKDLQDKARIAIEQDGRSQKETAKIVGVSEKTIGSWIVKFGWEKKTEIDVKRQKANLLIVVQGFQQKEAAQMVGVSEKTVGTWVKRYGWQPKKKHDKQSVPVYGFATDFKQYTMLFAPHQAKKICSLVDEYLNSLETD